MLVNEHGFENFLNMYDKKAKFIYFLVCFLQPIVLPLPEPVTVIGGSSVFGPLTGAIIGFIGTFLGIVVMFYISRSVSRNFIEKRINKKKLERFNRYIQNNELLVILVLFILPILPDEIICVGAGLAGINKYKFLGVALIAKLGTSFSLSYSLKLLDINYGTIIVVLIIALAVILFKRKKRAK